MRGLGIRARVVLLVVAAALPALALSIYGGLERRQSAEEDARTELGRFATLAAKHQEESLHGVRQLLFALTGSAVSLVKNPEECTRFFNQLVIQSGGLYHSMGIHGPDGLLICNNATWTDHVNVNDRRYFRGAADGRQFTVGNYQMGRTTGRSGLNFGFPAVDETGKLVGVVFAGADIDRLNEVTSSTPLPAGGTLTVLDHAGTIISRHPAGAGRVGEKARNPAVIAAVARAGDSEFDATDTQGQSRLYALRIVGRNPDRTVPLHVVVSIPHSVVLAEANRALLQTVGGIVIATLLLLVAAWYGAGLIVVRKIGTMLKVAQRVRSGDLTARTGFVPGSDELAALGRALDDMAQSLENRDAELQRALAALHEEATTDPLSGLYNRRYLWDFLKRELVRAQRRSLPVAVVMLDIDHFKRFNDTFGHRAGDAVIKRVSDVITRSIRGSDIACRYGGEEFIAVLPEATIQTALQRAEIMRRDLEAMEMGFEGQPLGKVTGSFGVAVFPQHGAAAEALVRAADEALYEAKGAGRNRVVLHGQGGKPPADTDLDPAVERSLTP